MAFFVGTPNGNGWEHDPHEDVVAANNRKFQGDQGDLTRANQLAVAQVPYDYKRGIFNQIWPSMQGLMGGFNSQGSAPGGQSGQGPHINAGPIWDNQQIQQRVNATRAQNDASTNNQMTNMRQDLAGRGVGAKSPLASLLQSNMQAQNIGTNAQASNDIRWNAAQGNADYMQKGGIGQETQFANRMQEDIERRKTQYGALSSMLGAMGSFI